MTTLTKIKRYFNLEKSTDNPIRIPDIRRERLAVLFSELGFARGVEVGVNKGYYSSVLCKVNPGLKLFSVDIWRIENCYKESIKTLSEYNCVPIKLPSVTAATLFDDGSFDFVYIDGDHAAAPFTADLEAWEPKVRRGGIVAGHDYKISDVSPSAIRCKVVQVVDAWVAKHKIDPWFLIGESFKTWPSWFWVKEA